MNARPQALLLDIQGVLVDNAVALDGAVDTVLKARCRRGLPIRLVTNTATRHHKQLLQELRTLGFALEAEELFTAPLAALSWFSGISCDHWRWCIQRSHHSSGGWELTRMPTRAVGEPTACCWAMPGINSATPTSIGRNRRFRVGGHWMLDAGAFLQALEYGAGCRATVVGKPSAAFFAEVVQSLGLPAVSCLMVGDDVEADVQGAIDAGLKGALVQSGKYRPGDEIRLPPEAAMLREIRAVTALLG